MIRPTRHHTNAITRCLMLLKSGLNDNLEKRFWKDIERDMDYLADVQNMLYEFMANPTLPFSEASVKAVDPEFNHVSDAPN